MSLRRRERREHGYQFLAKLRRREGFALKSVEEGKLLGPLPLHIEDQASLIHLRPQPISGIVQAVLVPKENQGIQLLIQ